VDFSQKSWFQAVQKLCSIVNSCAKVGMGEIKEVFKAESTGFWRLEYGI
jgi:hypothetical protein